MQSTTKFNYRRKLPHKQKDNRPLFITLNTYQRWTMPPHLRTTVLDCCLRHHMSLYELHAAVIMPNHVHLLLSVGRDAEGWPYSVSDVVRAIKGPSAKYLNRALGRTGRVWQDECFDHVLRSDESLSEKISYILQNPVRARLVKLASDYPWAWFGDAPYLPRR